jgi:uncharacterized membrane protein
LCGAAFYAADPIADRGAAAGVGGSIVGTWCRYEFCFRLVKATGGNDLPIALAEDIVAIGGLLLIAMMMTGDVWTCSRCLERSDSSRYKRKATRA